jgi:hypothetical protein
VASLSGTDNTVGTGDDPSPTTATGANERMAVAPLMELSAPASIRAARVASMIFFRKFTVTSNDDLELPAGFRPSLVRS